MKKKLFIVAVLAAQILTACGQNKTQAPSCCGNTAAHDTAWYSNKMNELGKAEVKLMNDYRTLSAAPQSADKDTKIKQLYASADSLSDIEKATTLEIVRKFKDTKYPARFLKGSIAYSFDYDELKEICDPKSGYYNEEGMKDVKRLFAALELRHPGLQFHELTMQDMDGKTVNLSQWAGKGKYVLVDFWASWCGPCRKEMPNVVEAYSKFKDKNFEIVGVSLDSKKDSWTAAVKQLGMTWPQMSDLKGWKSAANTVYGINSIPANVLLDPQGKIIAIDLRGEDLQNKLAEVLK